MAQLAVKLLLSAVCQQLAAAEPAPESLGIDFDESMQAEHSLIMREPYTATARYNARSTRGRKQSQSVPPVSLEMASAAALASLMGCWKYRSTM